MKQRLWLSQRRARCAWWAVGVLSCWVAMTGVRAAGSNTVCRLVLELTDGSRVIGTPQITSLPVQTDFAKVDVPLERVRSVKLAADHGTANITLTNGDRLQGRLALPPLALETVFGKVTVPVAVIRGLSVTAAGVGRGAGPLAWRDAMLLYYTFDQEDAAQVKDDSGNGRDATVTNAKWNANGRQGGAYEFDGRSALIRTPVVDNTGELTWSAWICPKSFDTVCAEMPMQVMGLVGHAWVWNSDNTSIFFHGTPQELALGFCVQHDNATVLQHPLKELPKPDTWHHVAVTINDEGRALYLDGEPVAKDGDKTRLGSKCAMIIGANDNGPQRYFNGLIDEVLVLNKALTADEIRRLYQAAP